MIDENSNWYRWAQLRDFLDATREELAGFNRMASREGSTDSTRRIGVRVIFSCVEAHVFHLKSTALAIDAGRPVPKFNPEEVLELQELRFGKNGEVVKAKIPLKDSIKVAFSYFARSLDRSYAIDFGEPGGVSFCRAIEIRDRITHPKSAASWIVSEEHLALVEEGWIWFTKHLADASKPNLQQ